MDPDRSLPLHPTAMTSHEALHVDPHLRQRFNPLTLRATSHSWASSKLIALFLAASWVGACDRSGVAAPGGSGTTASTISPQAELDSLRRAYEPISPTATSDKRTAWRNARRDRLAELERGPASLAPLALDTFKREVKADDEWRSALLSVAAHTDSELARALLESLTVTYDGSASLGVRTEAMRLLCQTSPTSATELFQPILIDPRPRVTYPPKEQILRQWIVAARSIRKPVDETLATIATDIAQPADVRYVAVDELGSERESNRGRKALEAVLVESGSDGMLRRKAAQALRSALPPAELCAILLRISQLESDPAFINFLADMLDKNCQ